MNEWNLAICIVMDGAREYNVMQNKLIREKQKSDDLTYMWNKQNKKVKGGKREIK